MVHRCVILLSVAAIACGCPGPKKPESPPPSDSSGVQTRVIPSEDADSVWEGITRAVPLDAERDTTFLAAEEAPECPVVQVKNGRGDEISLQLGRPGYVTVVVVWTVETAGGKAAVRYVSDLTRRYPERRWRVRGVGIVERTVRAHLAPVFAGKQGIELPLYYDDLSALKRLSRAIGARVKTAVPSVFIIDRQMRLRFHRPGFLFTIGAAGGQPAGQQLPTVVFESAPAGHGIEDYLKRILQEG